jgi:hypothetical protein
LGNGAIKEPALKIGALILVLLAVATGPSALAKAMVGHHADRVARAPSHRRRPAPDNGPTVKNARDKNAGDQSNVEKSETPLPSRDNARNVKSPKLQIVKPNNALRPRVGVSVPFKPPVRNAIGQTAAPAGSVKAGGVRAETDKAPEAGGAVPSQGGFQRFNGAAGTSGAKPIVRPGEGVALSNRDTIGGTGLIRPAMVGTVGGPAKSSGINGTLLRPKRK